VTTKLLAVDDSKTMRRVLDITFGGDEFQTTICGSAAEALQAIRADRPEVALLDASLGGDSGYELCRQIKAEAPDVRVLILSSKHRPYDERQGAGVGAEGNFDKPFDSAKLIERVNGLLGVAPAVAPAPVARPPVAAPAAQPSAAPRPVLASAPARPAAAASPPVSAVPRPAVASSAPRPAPVAEARPVAPSPLSARPQAPPTGSAPVAAAVGSAAFSDKLKELGLSQAQLEAVLSLSREVVEQVVWEVVPTLAETLIKEEIARLTAG